MTKKRGFFLITLQLMLLFAIGAVFLMKRGKERLICTMEDREFFSDVLQRGEEGFSREGDGQIDYGKEREKILEGNLGPLPGGHYTLNISYDGEMDSFVKLNAEGGEWQYVKSGEIQLNHARHFVSYDLFLAADVTGGLKLIMEGAKDSGLLIRKIELWENLNGIKLTFLCLLFLFFTGDLILFNLEFLRRERKTVLFLAGILLLSLLPVFVNGNFEGHDLDSHLLRIEGISVELKAGHLPARILSVWNEGYGDATSVFYGDLLLYIPASLRLMGVTLSASYKCYLVLIALLTVLFSFFSFSEIAGDREVGLLLCLIYTASSYRLSDIFVRSALGEYTALAFFPLILLSLERLYRGDEKKLNPSAVFPMVLSMLFILCSHLLSTVYALFFILLTCVILLPGTLKPGRIKSLLLSGFTVLLAGAYFWVPFLDYYLNVPVYMSAESSGGAHILQLSGVSPGELFAFFRRPGGDITPYVTGRMQLTPGPVLVFALLMGLGTVLLFRTTKRFRFYLAYSCLFLILSSSYFPWDILCQKLPLINALAYLQFPYRFLGFGLPVFTVFAGELLLWWRKQYGEEKGKRICFAALILAVGSALYFSGRLFEQGSMISWRDGNEMNSFTHAHRDYTPLGGPGEGKQPQYDFQGDYISEGMEEVRELNSSGTDRTIYAKASAEGGWILIPAFYYPGYELKDEQGNAYPVSGAYRDQICGDLPAGFEGILQLQFAEPWYWRVSEAVSVLTWIGIVLCYVNYKRKKRAVDI